VGEVAPPPSSEELTPRRPTSTHALIDVLLVLLIIFMVVAPVAPQALDASLLDKRGPTLEPPRTGLVLEVRADDFS
jgi:biopolymer transport protein ExbD